MNNCLVTKLNTTVNGNDLKIMSNYIHYYLNGDSPSNVEINNGASYYFKAKAGDVLKWCGIANNRCQTYLVKNISNTNFSLAINGTRIWSEVNSIKERYIEEDCYVVGIIILYTSLSIYYPSMMKLNDNEVDISWIPKKYEELKQAYIDTHPTTK